MYKIENTVQVVEYRMNLMADCHVKDTWLTIIIIIIIIIIITTIRILHASVVPSTECRD